jgi:hypothetical protein
VARGLKKIRMTIGCFPKFVQSFIEFFTKRDSFLNFSSFWRWLYSSSLHSSMGFDLFNLIIINEAKVLFLHIHNSLPQLVHLGLLRLALRALVEVFD